ncbi:MAG: HD domain-containing phosphohydrolase [Chloroflexota bacterium]
MNPSTPRSPANPTGGLPGKPAHSPRGTATLRDDQGAVNLMRVLEEANRIASMTSLEDLLEQMLQLMIRVSGATNGTLYLLDRDAHELVFMVVEGAASDRRLKGKRIKENMGIVGAAVSQGTPIVIEDLSNDPRWYVEFHPELASRLKNAITLPLLLQARPIGAVQIFNYSHTEVELLQMLGNRMASEVDKTLLLQKAQRSNQRLRELVEAMGQIGAVLDQEELLALLTENTACLLEADISSVYIIEATAEGPKLLTRNHPHGATTPPTLQPMLSMQSFQAASVVSAPLRARPISVGKERSRLDERIIGGLMAFNKPQGGFDEEDTQMLGILAGQASTVLQIATLYGQANQLFIDFIQALAATIDATDPYTRGHSQRVAEYSVAIAQEMGIHGDLLMDIRIGSLLHDIGKLGVPDSILTKPGNLTDEEYEQMKKHPGIGYKIIEKVQMLHNMLPCIVEHHERLDGTGYPMGLRGEQISQMGRIVAVADVYDALTTDRPYRKAMDLETVLDYLHKNIGRQFDPECVEAMTRFALKR